LPCLFLFSSEFEKKFPFKIRYLRLSNVKDSPRVVGIEKISLPIGDGKKEWILPKNLKRLIGLG